MSDRDHEIFHQKWSYEYVVLTFQEEAWAFAQDAEPHLRLKVTGSIVGIGAIDFDQSIQIPRNVDQKGDGGALEFDQPFNVPPDPLQFRYRLAIQSGGLNCRPPSGDPAQRGNTRMSVRVARYLDKWDPIGDGWTNIAKMQLVDGNFEAGIYDEHCG